MAVCVCVCGDEWIYHAFWHARRPHIFAPFSLLSCDVAAVFLSGATRSDSLSDPSVASTATFVGVFRLTASFQLPPRWGSRAQPLRRVKRGRVESSRDSVSRWLAEAEKIADGCDEFRGQVRAVEWNEWNVKSQLISYQSVNVYTKCDRDAVMEDFSLAYCGERRDG